MNVGNRRTIIIHFTEDSRNCLQGSNAYFFLPCRHEQCVLWWLQELEVTGLNLFSVTCSSTVVLKCILEKCNVNGWTELKWLRTGSNGKVLSTRQWTLGCHNRWEFLRPTVNHHLFNREPAPRGYETNLRSMFY